MYHISIHKSHISFKHIDQHKDVLETEIGILSVSVNVGTLLIVERRYYEYNRCKIIYK